LMAARLVAAGGHPVAGRVGQASRLVGPSAIQCGSQAPRGFLMVGVNQFDAVGNAGGRQGPIGEQH